VLGGTGDSKLTNYVVAFQDATTQVAVIHIPTKTIIYKICFNTAAQGTAINGAQTSGTVQGPPPSRA